MKTDNGLTFTEIQNNYPMIHQAVHQSDSGRWLLDIHHGGSATTVDYAHAAKVEYWQSVTQALHHIDLSEKHNPA